MKKSIFIFLMFTAFRLEAAISKIETIILGSATHDAGTWQVTAVNIPAGAEVLKIAVDVTDMKFLENSIEFNFEISFDAGATWRSLGIARFQGGVPGIRAGNPPYISNMEQHLPDSANRSRSVRGFVKINGSPVILKVISEIR